MGANLRKPEDATSSTVRFRTREVTIGNLSMGGNCPVRIQSMTSVPTMDTRLIVKQIIRMIEAGCEYVRITTRNIREAGNLSTIKKELKNRGYDVPLIADVHFNPAIAETAARIVEKVRINPGNYLSEDKTLFYASDEQVRERIRNRLLPLIRICKTYGAVLRIGSNHGSLSKRMVDKYGDTPMGMVESALEFVRICRLEDFNNLVISMKSSNTRIMIYSNRLLVKCMLEEGMDYPIHLGVTEAGEGEDGRIKSAIGIGTLLGEGIGDTIRVSLTEDPEFEIPVARMILMGSSRQSAVSSWQLAVNSRQSAVSSQRPVLMSETNSGSAISGLIEYQRRETVQVGEIGGGKVPVVATDESLPSHIITVKPDELTKEMIFTLEKDPGTVLVAESKSENCITGLRDLFKKLADNRCLAPVIIKISYPRMDPQELLIRSSIHFGSLLVDGLGDGIWMEAQGQSKAFIDQLSYGILQGSRCCFTKTEFITCPSCGRTLFNIQETVHRVRERMGHLKNLKIAVMGCIVNGPGEMADADYGYVGSGKGKVTLYKGKTIVRHNVDEKDALNALEELIRVNADWSE